MAIRVALADDNLLMRQGIAHILSEAEGYEIAASCEDLASLRTALDEHEIDVVVTDIRMPPDFGDEGIQLAAELRRRRPEIGVVILSNYDDPGYALALLDSGTEGRAYLLKDRLHDSSHLLAAVSTVASGGSIMDPKVVEPLMHSRTRQPGSPLGGLTPRELEVLREVAEGKSNQAIAESLVLTKRAVEKHVNSIFLKLDLTYSQDVSKRVAAALLFLSEQGAPAARR